MNKTKLTLLTLAGLLLSMNVAGAADVASGKTREQVRSELRSAHR